MNNNTKLANVVALDFLIISKACHSAINRSVYRLFKEDGFSIAIIIPSTSIIGDSVRHPDPEKTEDPPLFFLKTKGHNPRTMMFNGLVGVLKRWQPENIIYDGDPISITALILGTWAKINGHRFYCITCENMSIKIKSQIARFGISAFPVAVIKRVLLFFAKMVVEGIFVINNEGLFIFQSEGFKNTKKIPLGIDTTIFKQNSYIREIKRKELSLDCFTIGFFGRVVPEKGLHHLLLALSKLKTLEWVLVVDEFLDYTNSYRQQIITLIDKLELKNRIKYINPNHYEIADYMNAVDVVCLPSISTNKWTEQYGRVASEAMACGKTVIASDSGALPMLLNGYGVLFSEGDIKSLISILQNFIISKKSFTIKYSSEEISKYSRDSLSIEKQKELMISFINKGLGHD